MKLLPLILLCLYLESNTCYAQQKGFLNQRPNIIILYADDLGYGDVSCYGATKIHTPNIDLLAKEGLRFTNGHSTASTCTPSRYSLLTGEYAWRKKGTGILPGDAGLIISTEHATLPSMLKKAGYKTAAIGKWHLGMGEASGPDWNGVIKPGPNEIGFDYSFVFPATADRVPTIYVENHKTVALDERDSIEVSYQHKVGTDPTGKEQPELLKMKSSIGQGHDGTIVNGIGRIGWMRGGQRSRWVDEELADDFTRQAEFFIEQNKSNPFFLYFALSDIHVPRMPNTRFKGKSGLGYRGDAILQMDYTVGQILKIINYLGLSKNTIIIFSSDNGPVLDDGYQDGAVELVDGHKPTGQMSGGKYSILEGGTRVPLIIRWPEFITNGVSNALVSQVDFLRSFAAFTNQSLALKDAPDSYDVLNALYGKSDVGRDMLVEQAEGYMSVKEGGALALVKGDWKYIEPHEGPKIFKPVNIASGFDEHPQLYNLKVDISEKNNVSSKNPALVKQMATELAEIKNKGYLR